MSDSQGYVLVPKEAVGDDQVRILEWLIPDGHSVTPGTVVALAETSKATFEIAASLEGVLFHLVRAGELVAVGAPIAAVGPAGARPVTNVPETGAVSESDQRFTRKAIELMEKHGIRREVFGGRSVVRESDVEAYLLSVQTPRTVAQSRFFGSEELDPQADWDGLVSGAELTALHRLLANLRRRLKAKWNRHVPVGTLLHDRWELAREYRFGEGTSVYDECLILGDVTVGRHCWVGPFTILDGNFAPLRIGDYTSIGAGSHVYSHDTIEHAITGGQARVRAADTLIGRCCFISPMAIVGPGSRIGDHSFVAVGSYVHGEFPEYSYIAGNPARRVGRVEVRDNRVLLMREQERA